MHKLVAELEAVAEGPFRIRFSEIPSLPGRDLPPSGWMELNQSLVSQFAESTDDFQWIHVDPVRTQKELGHGTIVHGFMTLSLLVALSRGVLEISDQKKWINYGINKVRFLNPIAVGSRVRLHQKILAVEPKGDGYLLTRHCSVEIEGEAKPAMIAEWLDIIY